MALWRSWLARRPVTAEVAGSSPVRVAILSLEALLEKQASGLASFCLRQRLILLAHAAGGAGKLIGLGAVGWAVYRGLVHGKTESDVLICCAYLAVCRVLIRAQRTREN